MTILDLSAVGAAGLLAVGISALLAPYHRYQVKKFRAEKCPRTGAAHLEHGVGSMCDGTSYIMCPNCGRSVADGR